MTAKKTIVQLFLSYYTVAAWGGAEKVCVKMSNLAVQKGYRVINIYNDRPEAKFLYPLDERVETYNLAITAAIVPFSKRLLYFLAKKLRIKIKNPADTHKIDLLAKNIDNILANRAVYAIICYNYRNALAADKLRHKAPKILMDHGPSDPEAMLKYRTPEELAVIDRMSVYQTLLPNFVKLAQKYTHTQVVCIPNIVPQIKTAQPAKKKAKIIINIGRINKVHKRQRLLVEAFARIAPQFPDWQLHLYGDTPTLRDKFYKKNIEKFIRRHDLQKQALFKGVTKNPLQALQNAAICGFPSAYESWGLSLTEAMSSGLPAIGFRSTPAVNDLIIDGHSGFLAKDIADYAQKLATLLNNAKLREQMGQNARQQMQEYTEDKVWRKWENLFKEINKQDKPNN
ncbi:MAG: glycosyltransferase [Candidatus Margulisbacteria bacterium]|jgi:glycosyltransferase involved in cell wall biosynthesis|nr:glycosyltransferase [Candidatus Margulisiibacteriota bacterium]